MGQVNLRRVWGKQIWEKFWEMKKINLEDCSFEFFAADTAPQLKKIETVIKLDFNSEVVIGGLILFITPNPK